MQTSALASGLSWVFASPGRADGANAKSGNIHGGLEDARLRPRAGRRHAAAARRLNARAPISPPVACSVGATKASTGHWSIKNGRLCLSSQTNPHSECWTVIRNRDGTLRLFTVEGVRAGYLGVVRDNPNKF